MFFSSRMNGGSVTHLAFMTVVVLPLVAYPMAMPTRCSREVCGMLMKHDKT